MAMRTVTVVRQYLASVFFIAIGLIASGCGDTATVNPVVELASLTVTPGTLQPAFNGGTTQYRVQVTTDITSVRVTAQPAVAGDTVTINGQTTTSRDIPLGEPGSSTPVNIVVSETDTNSRTYTVLVNRAGLAGNNSLASLAVSPGTLAPAFDPNLQAYTVDVPNNVGSITVTPALSDPAATITVNGQPTSSGLGQTITLGPAGQPTNIPIIVTAQNGNPKSYQLTVSRGVSNNNNLQNLTISPGTLSPTFNAGTEAYSVGVGNNVNNVTVTATPQDANATARINGQNTNSRSINLGNPGTNTFINIVVTAQNGTQKTYVVTVSRGVSANNNLQGLTVSQGSLAPAFNPGTVGYTVNVASTVSSVTVTPTLQDATASMAANGQGTNSGQARTIQLGAPGSNTPIFIIVTAQNGTQKTYTVGVIRATLGGNNNLSALAISPGTLDPTFSANTTNYSVDVASTVTSVLVTPREQDTAATTTVNGQATNSGQARTVTLNGAGSNTVINIAVIAPNGSQKTYTISVERAAQASNNNLSALTVTPGPLSPSFAAGTLAYTVNVASTITSVNVSATKADSNAVMSGSLIAGAGTASDQASIQLGGPGTTRVVSITMTAPNGNSKTYTISVERAAQASNNNLSALTVTPGPLSPSFAAGTLAYTVNVASTVTSVAVSATKADSSSVISGDIPNSGQADIALTGPGTTTPISITVTAPNGASKTYTINIIRAEPAAPPSAPASPPDLISADDSCLLKFGITPTGTNDDCEPNSGTSRDDNFTNVTTPRFRIPQPGAGTPNLYVDGIKVDSTFDQATSTLKPTAALSGSNDGVQHSITSTVTNTTTNLESGQSGALIVTISTGQSGV